MRCHVEIVAGSNVCNSKPGQVLVRSSKLHRLFLVLLVELSIFEGALLGFFERFLRCSYDRIMLWNCLFLQRNLMELKIVYQISSYLDFYCFFIGALHFASVLGVKRVMLFVRLRRLNLDDLDSLARLMSFKLELCTHSHRMIVVNQYSLRSEVASQASKDLT